VNDAVPAAPAAAPAGAHAPREELFNALTHGLGSGLAIVGAVVLLSAASRHGTSPELTACAVYAVTLVGAYVASTLSHVFANPSIRAFFRVTDQAMIFLFIAGSWTPIAVAWLHGPVWWTYHAIVWGIALIGFVSKALFAHRTTVGTVSAILYLALGWTPVLVAYPLLHACPLPLLLWLLAGGVCYTIGLVFFHFDTRVPYFHAAWHILVIAGSACHYLGILRYCTGRA
jgi:hemolysin III